MKRIMSPEEAPEKVKDVCVCILAHNEQKHIARTIHAIRASAQKVECDIIVYANGCTDATTTIVQDLSKMDHNIFLREVPEASKANAWNLAFHENHYRVLMFSDGDVEPLPGILDALCNLLSVNSKLALVCPQFWPTSHGLSLEKKIVGFLQYPLVQDFLSGQIYAIKRDYFVKRFNEIGISGLPGGIVAEDTFIERITDNDSFLVIDDKAYYEPPMFNDYLKYLARMRWQEEQLDQFYSKYFQDTPLLNLDRKRVLLRKISKSRSIRRFFLGVGSNIARFMVKYFFKRRIGSYYKALGPVGEQGAFVLSSATRSMSSK